MKKSSIVEFISNGVVYKSILIDNGDDSFESFPIDENNPRYQQWITEGNSIEEL